MPNKFILNSLIVVLGLYCLPQLTQAQQTHLIDPDWAYLFNKKGGEKDFSVVFIDSLKVLSNDSIFRFRKAINFKVQHGFSKCLPLTEHWMGFGEIVSEGKRGIITGKLDTIWIPNPGVDTLPIYSNLNNTNGKAILTLKPSINKMLFKELDTVYYVNIVITNSKGDTIMNTQNAGDLPIQISRKYGLISTIEWLSFPESLNQFSWELIGLSHKSGKEWKGAILHPNGTDFDLGLNDEWHTVLEDYGMSKSIKTECKNKVISIKDSAAFREYIIRVEELVHISIRGSKDTSYTTQKFYNNKIKNYFGGLSYPDNVHFLYNDLYSLDFNNYFSHFDSTLNIWSLRTGEKGGRFYKYDSICWANYPESNPYITRFQMYPLGSYFYLNSGYNYLPVYYKMGGKSYGIPLGIDESQIISSLKVYPNPASNEFEISSEVACEVIVYSNLGVIVFENHIPQFTQRIKSSDWPEGIYHIKINSSQGVAFKRLVLNRY
jgi:hypothetical protein